jgi:predicted metal-dependent peptidase
MDFDRKMARAKSLLVMDHPFFGMALLRRPIILDETLKFPAGVDARGQIYVKPSFFDNKSTGNLQFVLAHECMHYMLLHSLRRGWRDHRAWNIACDKVINDLLIENNVGEAISKDEMVWQDGAREHSAEALYDDNDKEQQWGSGDMGDDMIPTEMSAEERSMIETSVKIEMSQCAAIARAKGKLKGTLSRLVEESIESKIPWHQELLDFMQGMVSGDPSWSRPNRRFVSHRVYLPESNPEPTLGTFVLGVDTSGSISGKEMAEAEGHLNRIMELCHPEKVHVLYCDTDVGSTDEYDLQDLPAKFQHPTGGGGTDLRKMFDWLDGRGLEPEVMVIITDGYTPYPEVAPPYPVVWVMTTDVTPPWGRVLRYF